MQSKYLRYRTLADGYSALKSPLAEKYADAAEALERLAADNGEAEVVSVHDRDANLNTDRPQNAALHVEKSALESRLMRG